jgi:SHS2 domain-containing protein
MRELVPHTADLGIVVRAASLDAVFAEAAIGLFEIIVGDLAQVRPRGARPFVVAGDDPTWLLLDWLAELHAAFEIDRWLFREFDVAVSPRGLRATARGEPYDPAVHRLAHEIKAITQHDLAVRRSSAGWEATFVVDI